MFYIDDELDWGFSDLEDMEDSNPIAMTAEKAKAQLSVGQAIDLEPISEDSFSKIMSTKEATGEKEVKKTEEKKTEDKNIDDKKAKVKKDVGNTVKQGTSHKQTHK
jgi:hypothetical protein